MWQPARTHRYLSQIAISFGLAWTALEVQKVVLDRIQASHFFFSFPPGAASHGARACVGAPGDIDSISRLSQMYQHSGWKLSCPKEQRFSTSTGRRCSAWLSLCGCRKGRGCESWPSMTIPFIVRITPTRTSRWDGEEVCVPK